MKPERNHTASANRRGASIDDALSAVAKISTGLPSAIVFEHGTLQVKMYRPAGHDAQAPHTRDEIYVIARGAGWFVNGNDRHAFQAGDVLFVPAGVAHRFEDFSADFCTWVMFYGPEGGEKAGPGAERDSGLRA